MRDYWGGIIDGAAGAAAFAVVAAFGFGELGWKSEENLISGLAAVVAAFATVRIINRQILESTAATNRQMAQIAELEAQRRMAKNLSQRAALPGALSSLVNFLSAEVQIWNRLYKPGGTPINIANALPPPRSAPYDSIRALTECIEFADGEAIVALSALVQWIQIYEARMRTQNQASITTSFHIETQIVAVIGLRARVDSLFSYARGAEGPTPLDYGTSARILGYDPSSHPQIYATMQRLKMI